ncbi:MAG: glycosyltransferase [Verrucomicrobiota bacterium]|nr:glycosyltransferase [Verrucomicrobiota bacterium]
MAWSFLRGSDTREVAPDFIDFAAPKLRGQLEKSCGRDLQLAWSGSADVSGEPVRAFYLWSADLQARYPLGLLPIGQKRMTKWLLNQGRPQHRFRDEEIIAFVRETAANPARGIAETYLITPEWQLRFPRAESLLSWLRESFPEWRAVRKLREVELVAPSLLRAADGVNMLAHFCYPSGLQQGALAARTALQAAGVAVSCRDVPTGVRTELLPRGDWLGIEVFDISLIVMSPMPYSENCYERAGLMRREGVYRIACWSWELDTIPADWPSFEGLFDEIWTPTTFVADAMRRRYALPVFDMPHALESPQPDKVDRAEFGLREGEFVFFFMFDLCSELERKNPLGLIRAFRRAFADTPEATLLIKTVRADLAPAAFAELERAAAGANVRIVNELATRERALGMIAMCDCYVSLHRAEGFGLTLAEAMMLGKPVIATGYSGNLDFMNAENSRLVDYRLVLVERGGEIYQSGLWAEPSEKHAAALMREVFSGREAAEKRAQRGRAEVTKQLAPAAIGQRMKARIEEIRRR